MIYLSTRADFAKAGEQPESPVAKAPLPTKLLHYYYMIENGELENIYAFTYLGAEIPGDGDPLVPVKHRCDVAWGRFGEYRKTLMSSKLPIPMRCRLFNSLVSSTMSYGCEAWKLTIPVKRMVNSVNSKNAVTHH